MAQALVVPLTPGITVEGGYTIRLTAIDPNTGNVVSGVNVSKALILATNLNPTNVGPVITQGPFVLVPGPGT